jgi:hypothetical protein
MIVLCKDSSMKEKKDYTVQKMDQRGKPQELIKKKIPVGARFSAPVQTGPGAHPASYPTGPGSLPGGKAAGAWS